MRKFSGVHLQIQIFLMVNASLIAPWADYNFLGCELLLKVKTSLKNQLFCT